MYEIGALKWGDISGYDTVFPEVWVSGHLIQSTSLGVVEWAANSDCLVGILMQIQW